MGKLNFSFDFLKRKFFSKKDIRELFPLLTAIFILSIFAGVLLNIVIKHWVLTNIDVIRRAQAKEEALKIEKLLNRYN